MATTKTGGRTKVQKDLHAATADSAPKKQHKARQNSDTQFAAANLRETASNEKLLNAGTPAPELPINALRDESEKNAAENSSENAAENSLKKIVGEIYESEKANLLLSLSLSSLEKGLNKIYPKNAAEIFASFIKETDNCKYTFVDSIDDKTTPKQIITFADDTKMYLISIEAPQTAAAVVARFNAFMKFGRKSNITCLQPIIKAEKAKNSINRAKSELSKVDETEKLRFISEMYGITDIEKLRKLLK